MTDAEHAMEYFVDWRIGRYWISSHLGRMTYALMRDYNDELAVQLKEYLGTPKGLRAAKTYGRRLAQKDRSSAAP